MEGSNLYKLIALAFVVYIAFAFGIIFVKRKLRNEKSIKATVFIPILLSFISGIAILMYAFSS